MKAVMFLLVAVALAGCGHQAESTATGTNPAIPVDTLFSHEGCTVYRFLDAGSFHYFSKCPGAGHSSTTANVSCGKSCRREDNIPTN